MNAHQEAEDYLDALYDAKDRIALLEAENAALWAFVTAVDASNECLDTEHWSKCGPAEDDVLAARVALDEYERSIG